MDEKKNSISHQLMMKDREGLNITGVTQVVSLEPELMLLVTRGGKLKINGHDMHVRNLDIEKGDIELSGRIDGINYTGEKKDGTLLQRMFK